MHVTGSELLKLHQQVTALVQVNSFFRAYGKLRLEWEHMAIKITFHFIYDIFIGKRYSAQYILLSYWYHGGKHSSETF